MPKKSVSGPESVKTDHVGDTGILYPNHKTTTDLSLSIVKMVFYTRLKNIIYIP